MIPDRRRLITGGVLYVFVGMVLFFLILPNLVVVPASFSPTSILQFPPKGFSFRWYVQYWELPGWLSSTGTSLLVAVLTTAVSVPIGSLCAYGLVRGTFLGRRSIGLIVIFPIIIPSLVTAISIYKLFSTLHITGTLIGFVIGHSVMAIPFVVTIMTATLRGVDPTLELAARNLGAGRLRTLYRVTLPIAMPGVVSAAFFAFLISFDELLISIFISSPYLKTLPKRLWDGILFELDPTLAAVSTILVGMSLVILLLVAWLGQHMGSRTSTPSNT